MYSAHPCFWPKLSGKKSFNFLNSIIYLFIFKYLFFVLQRNFSIYFCTYYDTRNFMWKELQNTRTDTRYFRYYPCMICILIFPSNIWAKKCVLYTTKYGRTTITQNRQKSSWWKCDNYGIKETTSIQTGRRGTDTERAGPTSTCGGLKIQESYLRSRVPAPYQAPLPRVPVPEK